MLRQLFVASARRVPVIMLCSLVMLVSAQSAAYAHAALVRSEPSANARLATSPTRVRLLFSEEADPTLAQLSLVADDGSVTRLAAAGDPHDVHAIVAPVASLAPGSYRLVWRIVSADGHPVDGSIIFWVGVSAAQAPPAESAGLNTPPTWGPTVAGAPLVPATLRGIALGLLMTLGGLLFCMSWLREDPLAQRRPLRVAGWLGLFASVLLVLHLCAWILNATPDHRLAGDSTSVLLASRVGRVEMWRTALAVLALWALTIAKRTRLALLFVVLALIVSGASGHSAAIAPMWTEPARALHLLAGGAWLGALLYLIVRDGGGAETFASDALRVSSIALIAAVVVLLSGVVQALLFLSSPLDLFRSTYGLVLHAKIVGFLVLIAFGVHHRFRVLPRLARDATISGRFAVTIRREIGVMCAVVLLGGLLAYVSPPHDTEPHASSLLTIPLNEHAE